MQIRAMDGRIFVQRVEYLGEFEKDLVRGPQVAPDCFPRPFGLNRSRFPQILKQPDTEYVMRVLLVRKQPLQTRQAEAQPFGTGTEPLQQNLAQAFDHHLLAEQ